MIVVLLHTEQDGSLARGAFESITAARHLGEPFAVGLVGSDIANAAGIIANCDASKIFAVQGDAFEHGRYATDAAAAEAICRAASATVIIAPHTSRWARALPGVSHRLNGRIDTHVASIAPGPVITRWFYKQRIEAVLERTERPWAILLDSGAAPAWFGEPGHAHVENVPIEVTSRTTVVGKVIPKSDQQTIRPDAPLLFVAGAGWTKKQKDGQTHVQDAAKLIGRFLDVTHASLGSSKSLVDLSGEGQDVLPFLSHLNQVGQTGSTPRHPKGLATCCHGEEPHVVGWRFIKERRAINLDANCGWARGKADVVYVADAFEVIAKLNSLLKPE
jgi:electron transfer flavoprotein alpha subunit